MTASKNATNVRASFTPVERDRYWAIHDGYLMPDLEARTPGNTVIEFDQRMNLREVDEEDELQVVDGVAVIDIAGVLRKQQTLFERLFGGGGNYASITRQVNRAASDASIKSILLRIDSPGGTVAGGSETTDAIFSARQIKPVIAYASDLMASAAYRLGSQATAIYADRDAQVGSIGTYAVIPDYSKMADEIGMKVHVVKAGKFKGAGTSGTEITEEQLAEWQREIDSLNEIFLEEIVRGRGLTMERVRDLNDGRIHIGKQALDAGLIDGVCSLEDAIDKAIEHYEARVRTQMMRTIVTNKLDRIPIVKDGGGRNLNGVKP